jgi:hypothetical protein
MLGSSIIMCDSLLLANSSMKGPRPSILVMRPNRSMPRWGGFEIAAAHIAADDLRHHLVEAGQIVAHHAAEHRQRDRIVASSEIMCDMHSNIIGCMGLKRRRLER